MTLTKKQKKDLEQLLEKCLNILYKKDSALIKIGGMEQAIAFRFGLYLFEESKKIEWLLGLDIDMEYNKNENNSKKTPRMNNGTRPDLIIHSRGNNDYNILIIEIKGWWNTTLREADIIKLEDFTDQGGSYKYGYGLLLDLGIEKPKTMYFSDYRSV